MLEVDKCRERLSQYCCGDGIDIGYGGDPIISRAIGIDIQRFLNGSLCGDGANLRWFKDGILDFVFSSHFLEHLEKTEEVLREWVRVLKPGGFLILYLPHKDLYTREKIPCFSTEHKVEFDQGDIIKLLKSICQFEVWVCNICDRNNEYSFEIVAKKL